MHSNGLKRKRAPSQPQHNRSIDSASRHRSRGARSNGQRPPPVLAPGPRHPSPAADKPRGFLNRLKRGLSKTRKFLDSDIDQLFSGKRQ